MQRVALLPSGDRVRLRCAELGSSVSVLVSDGKHKLLNSLDCVAFFACYPGLGRLLSHFLGGAWSLDSSQWSTLKQKTNTCRRLYQFHLFQCYHWAYTTDKIHTLCNTSFSIKSQRKHRTLWCLKTSHQLLKETEDAKISSSMFSTLCDVTERFEN